MEIIKSIYRQVVPTSARKRISYHKSIADFRKLISVEGHVYNRFEITKSIFIHIPKAGGVSVIKSLYGDKATGFGHPTYKRFYDMYGENKFERYFKFTFVRNPWDRVLSAYHFLKKGGLNHMDRKFADEVLDQYASFEDFVLRWLSLENIWSWVHFYPQYSFIYDKNMNLMVNFIGRFENLEDDYNFIREKINTGSKLQHLNQSVNEICSYRNAYTDEMRTRIYDIYQKDIDLFSYDF